MQNIKSPINPKDIGNEVSNLQAALQLFLDNKIIATFQPPDSQTEEEIVELRESLKNEKETLFFGDATRQLVLFFQLQQDLSDQFDGAVEEKTAAKMNEILKALGAFDNAENTFIVKGFIYKSSGEGYPNIIVAAFDCDLRRTEKLGEIITNEQGYFEIKYSSQTFANNEKGNADVKIIALDLKNQLSKESEIYFNAKAVQEINLTLPVMPANKEKSEWERVNEQVLPLLKGQKEIDEKKDLKKLKTEMVYEDLLPEELKQDDVDFITKETGLDKNNIQLWSLAYLRNKEENRILPEIFYGWFRMGLATELKDLWARTNDELHQKLKEAVDKNIIPALGNGIEKIIAAINNARQDFHLQPAKDGEKPGLGDILNTAGKDWLSDEKKKRFVDIAKELDPDAEEDFSKKLNNIGFTTDEKNTLQKTLRLDKLTLSHPPLMEALHTYVMNDTDASLKPLATIHTDQWIDLAYTHGVPAGITQVPEDYAKQLANAVEDRLPTASLASKVSNGDILFNQPGMEKIAPLLKVVTDFDIVKDDIAAIAVEHKLDDESKGLLKKLQNLKKLGTRWEDTDAFINQGITSVQQIVEYSPEQLKAIFKDDIEPEKLATVQANAIAAQNIGIGLMGYLQPVLYGVKAYVMQSSNGQQQGRSTGSSAQPLMASSGTGSELDPTLRTLFGALEQCACEPCLSVLSPAAYYADLLNYIDHSPQNGNGAGEVLKQIRPDLYDLELSCDNAQIELPYIDLALEILENKVAFPLDIPLNPGVKAFEILPDKSIKIVQALIDKINSTVEGETEYLIAENIDNSNWVIKDRYRKWAILTKEESLVSSNYNIQPKDYFDITKFSIADLLQWLNSTNPTNNTLTDSALKTAFEDDLYKRSGTGFSSSPLSLKSALVYNVHKYPDGHYYIEYEIQNFVFTAVNPDPTKSDFVIKTADGKSEVIRTFGLKTVNAAEEQLKAGIIPEVLKFGHKYKSIKVEPVASSALGYKVSYSNHFYLYYNPLQLSIDGLTYQSTKANSNLFAQSQNRNPLAYQILAKNAAYPWSLPYNQPLTETRLLLEKTATSRLQLLGTIITEENKFLSAVWAREVLGISATQQIAITKSKLGDELIAAWGFHVGWGGGFVIIDYFNQEILLPNEGFKRTSVIMQQAAIDYTELQGLLKSKFINPESRISIRYDRHCDPTKMLLQNTDDSFFDRMHRFIRLWRVLGWSITQVDEAIMSDKIGAGKLDDPYIVCIAQIKMLQQQSDVPLDTVIAFFSPFSNDKTISYTKSGMLLETASLYNRVFQNRLVQNPINNDLAFNKFEKDTSTSLLTHAKTWANLLPCISAAFGILQPHLENLLQSGIVNFKNFSFTSNVTIDDLQSAWRNLSLARAMQLSIEDYAAAYKLIYPLTTPPPPSVSSFDSPVSLLNFIDEIKFIKQTGIKATELEKVLNGKNEEDILPVETAVTILSSLQKELRLIPKISLGILNLEGIKSELAAPPFIIAESDESAWNETGRWTSWGLKKKTSGTSWLVKDPQDQTKEIDSAPLELLKREDVLIQQINLLLEPNSINSEKLSSLLQLSFVTNNGLDTLKVDLQTKLISNLKPIHLDQTLQLIILAKATKASFKDINDFIKLSITRGGSPFDKSLTTLAENAQNIIIQQKDAIVNYFAGLYKQGTDIVDKMVSNDITVQFRSVADPMQLTSIFAIQHLASFDFWKEENSIKKDEVKASKEYGILIKQQKFYLLNQYWKGTVSQLKWFGKSDLPEFNKLIGLLPDYLSGASAPIPYLYWKRTSILFGTIQANPALSITVTDYLKALADTHSTTKVSDSRNVLAIGFGLKPEDVCAGATLQEMNTTAAGNFDSIKLCRLINYLTQLQKLGLNAAQYHTLITEPVNLPFESVRIARQILFARYGAGNYADALKEVNNKLRVQERDMLVDYLVWKENMPDANGLYEKYLIDVEMSACMLTTRLLQSTAAAQLFVQRCLLNLETEVNPSLFDKKRWEWTQNYRVWEANRKVFLYPENWLYPELRDDKTEPFKEMEGKLQTGNLVASDTKDVIKKYLRTVSQHSNIMVKGMFEFETTDNGKVQNNLLVIGRIQNQPLKYFWRVCSGWPDSNLTWTSWKEIRSDVSSLYVIPYAIDGEPYLAWPIIKEVEIENVKKWSILFKWTSLKDEKVSESYSKELFAPKYADKDIETSFTFKVTVIKTINEKYFTSNRISKSIAVECFCVIPKPLSNTDKQYDFGLLLNNIDTLVLPKDLSSLAFLKINAGLFINYNDGYKPLINQKVTLEVLSWTNKYTHPDRKITVTPPKIAEGYTDSSGFTTFSISLHDTIDKDFYSYTFSGQISWEIQVSANGKTKNITIDSSIIESKFNMLSDEELPAAFVMNYKCQLVSDKNENMPIGVFSRNERLPLAKFGKLEIFNNGQDCVSTQFSVGSESTILSNWTWGGYMLEGNKSDDTTVYAIIHEDEKGFLPLRIPEKLGINPYLVSAGSENNLEIIKGKNILANYTSWHYSDSFANFYVGWVKKTPSDPLEWLIIIESFNIANSALNYNTKNIIELQSSNDLVRTEGTKYGQLYLDYKFNSHRFNDKSIAVRQVNFNQNAPESIYNWEIFFHLFIRIAREHSNQHRFEEARKWFHYTFDPTSNDSSIGKERFWNFLPFRNNNKEGSVNKLLEILANPNSSDKEKETIQGQIDAWLADPFNPFAVARLRINAYEWFTVTAYIKNLIEWGDQLFRRDTRESINEATLLYVTASDILGRRPIPIASNTKSAQPLSYRALKKRGIDKFSNTWVTLIDTEFAKAILEFYNNLNKLGINPHAFDGQINELNRLSSIGSTYFCVPPNEKLPELWDTVADRLFKIRNCQNFDGVTRNLPLLDPPIDPELLIRARAAGVSIADALSDMYAPPPLYRFNMVVQKATDLCNEVKALGGAMLSAIEKKEAEHLSLLRSGQEIEMQKLVATVRQAQINEAAANIDAFKKSRENIVARIMYLQRQMGGTEATLNADRVPVLHESYINQPIANFDWTVADLAGLGLTKSETDQVVFMQTNNIFTLIGGGFHTASGLAHTLGASLAIVPAPADGPAKVANATGDALSSYGTFFNTMASHYAMLEKRSGMMAGWQRRRDEWLYQAKTAVLEINQIDKQIIASEIRKAIAEKELDNHYKQIEHTKTLDDYVRNQKFSSETLYTWMESRLSMVYKSAFDMAYEQAKKAEKAFRFELGDDLTNFITPGYWETMQRGLLAGEGLMQDLKRMEIAFMDRNKRDFEITKHISLRQLDPFALLQLKAGNSCNFDIPEVLFDMDFPGHYFRRIKSVSISIPCIAGPYTSVSAILSLTGNQLRRTAADAELSNGYSSNQSSIATSQGQNDSGMFELNFRDERYLPFEGCGANSSWSLELPELKQFDYNTISDVVVHLKYTARFDSVLKKKAADFVVEKINKIKSLVIESETGLHIPISLKHDMPNDWNLLIKNGTKAITLNKTILPYMAQAISGVAIDHIIFVYRGAVEIKKLKCFTINTTGQNVYIKFDPIQTGINIYKSGIITGITVGSSFTIEGYKSTSPTVEVVNNEELLSAEDFIILVKYSIPETKN